MFGRRPATMFALWSTLQVPVPTSHPGTFKPGVGGASKPRGTLLRKKWISFALYSYIKAVADVAFSCRCLVV